VKSFIVQAPLERKSDKCFRYYTIAEIVTREIDRKVDRRKDELIKYGFIDR
jgi:hypothetical protein